MIQNIKIGALEYLTAEGIPVPHCFTTRLGGVSRGDLSSMNIGASRGDEPENVLKNYKILADALGFEAENLVLSRQYHTDVVRVVKDSDRGAGLYGPKLEPCDGLVTGIPGIALTVFTADCTPILLCDTATGAVGAVHAGWRGTAMGIAARAVETMAREFGSRPENICAAIGPNIGFCHFETDADVPDALRDAFGSRMDCFIQKRDGKYFTDLKAVNGRILEDAGVKSIEISTDCTMCSPERYWSYRIVGDRRGSQGAIIVCREV